MRQVALLILLLVALAPNAVAATEAEASFSGFNFGTWGADTGAGWNAEADALAADGFADATFETGVETETGLPAWLVALGFAAVVQPTESVADPLVAPGVEEVAAAAGQQGATSPAADEVTTLHGEGASAGATGSATQDGATATASAQAGSQGTSQTASTASVAGDVIPQVDARPSSPPAGHAAEAAPEEDAPPVAGDAELATQDGWDVAVPSPPPLPVVVATTVAIATASSGLMFVVVPGWRTLALKWLRRLLGLAAFSRIAQADILNHGRRSELFEFIKQNPGERVEVARRTLGLSNGAMHYHLKVLADRDLIRIHKQGAVARLYVAGPKIQPAPYVPPQRRRFLEIINTRPGVTQREVAMALGVSERMASYHIQTMANQGLVDIRPEGSRKRLFARTGWSVAAAVAA